MRLFLIAFSIGFVTVFSKSISHQASYIEQEEEEEEEEYEYEY